jgi:NAD(P)-dependent dehydrogenase (short-subunit alcohol dehydrogenase family)
MYDITGKLALITGGTRGIGLGIARAVLERGGHVAINGRESTPEAEELRDRFGQDRVSIELGDVSVPEQASQLVERAAARSDRIDMLVHAAGGPAPGKIIDVAPADWMQAFAIHVHPVYHLFRAAHPYLAREGGAVLLVSSVAGLRGCPGTVAYQTVKGALLPLARALAFDHAPENIRVNVVAPGIIRTRFHEAMTDAAREHNLKNRIPLGREGTIEDVATASLELMCNPFITGEVLTVDGGMSMRVTG